jgi:hydrogenase small subunit
MSVTRRDFLRYCTLSAAALGLDFGQIGYLQEALANPNGPSVVWLIGSSCTGCSISFLNRISDKTGEPATVVDVLADTINLIYHPTIMGAAGETAAASLRQIKENGPFILVLEGAIPTAFEGHACVVYSLDHQEVTFQQAVQELAARAAKIICVGTCASFGGIPASGVNPTQAMGIRQYTGRPTINISGCPANPDWVIWTIVQLLTNKPITLDADGRPTALYSTSHQGTAEAALIHPKCPRNLSIAGNKEAQSFGESGHCLINLGCRGPFTKARCEASWNGIGGRAWPQPHPGHWCIGVNAPCHGCVEKDFPGKQSFYEPFAPA